MTDLDIFDEMWNGIVQRVRSISGEVSGGGSWGDRIGAGRGASDI